MLEYFLSFVYYLFLVITLIHPLLWIYKELTMGICRYKGTMKGKVVLITGGNNGIGFETSVELARRGAQLIIGCRNTQNVENRIQNRVPGAIVDVIKLDLSSTKSVNYFAEVVKSKTEIIDVLINNAGMVSRDKKESVDGFDLIMATNYLGHALLNHLLIDLIKRAGQIGDDCSKIILVSSWAAMDKTSVPLLCQRRLEQDYEVNFGVNKGEKNARCQYPKSKLAQIMYGKHLAKMMENENCNTMVVSLHPGLVRTDIFNGLKGQIQQHSIGWTCFVLGKSAWQGAQTTIYLAVSNFSNAISEMNGKFFADCRSKNWMDFRMPKITEDPSACKQVWDETMNLLRL